MIRNYMGLKSLIDPLTGLYPIEPSEAPAGGNVYSSYELWFGFGFDGHPGMRKLGDRFEWTDNFNTPNMTHRFDFIATDLDFTGTLARTINSHPDHDGVLQRLTATGEDTAISYYARWEEAVAGVRGPVDLNYSYADGAVTRLTEVTADDPRTAAVPYEAGKVNWSVYLLQLPRP